MDKKAKVSEIDVFLAGPLATWFSSCLDEKVTYESLVNGYLIHNLFCQTNVVVHDTDIYPSPAADSTAWRLRNLKAVLSNIRHFYEDELGQVIHRLPDIEKLSREPEIHVRELQLLLTLLLGCAVQCAKKQDFIKTIMQLDQAHQLDVVKFITQVIEVPDIVISIEMFADVANGPKAIECIRQICCERDEYKTQLRHHRELDEQQLSNDFCEKLQLKFKASSLEEQLLQKNEELEDVKDHLKECTKRMTDLIKINDKLALEAKNVQYYKDELDAALATTDRLEQENTRCKKKLTDLDRYKIQLEELKKNNKYLEKSKVALIKGITVQDGEKSKDFEKQVNELMQQVSDLTIEVAENRDKYWQVCEEKTELERLVKASYKQEQTSLQSHGIPSLKDDFLLNHAQSQVDKLQTDNENLTSFIEKLKQTLNVKTTAISILTQDNKKLLQTIDTLKDNLRREYTKSKNLENICKKALDKGKKLQQQELERLRSLLESAQNSASSEKSLPKNLAGTNSSTEVPKVQKCNVVRSRKLQKYVKPQV